MVRTYIRKRGPLPYTKAQLAKAVEQVKLGKLSARSASKLYNIPNSTLSFRVNNKRGVKSFTHGRSTALPLQEECKIAEGFRQMKKCGIELTKKEILRLIARYVSEKKIVTPFKNGVPGDDYCIRFKQRHHLAFNRSGRNNQKKTLDSFSFDNHFKLLKEFTDNLGPDQSCSGCEGDSLCSEDARETEAGTPLGEEVEADFEVKLEVDDSIISNIETSEEADIKPPFSDPKAKIQELNDGGTTIPIHDSRIDDILTYLEDSAANHSRLSTDEWSIYGQHVANKLRGYDKTTQALVQHLINNVLFDADMGRIKEPPKPQMTECE